MPSRLLLDALGVLMIHELLVCFDAALPRQVPPKSGLAPWQVRRTVDRLADAPEEDVPLADLAADVRLSPFHFARAFKTSTGLPPHRYQMQLRLERARTLLETTDLPVTEISARVGYDDPGYFARLFGRAYGRTPSRHRRERRA